MVISAKSANAASLEALADTRQPYVRESAVWSGYEFAVIPVEWATPRVLPKVPCIYIMATCTDHGTWGALYIGKCEDLQRRHRGFHHRRLEAQRMGFSHLHVRQFPLWDLDRVERALIDIWSPHLNDKHNRYKSLRGPGRGPPSGRPGFINARHIVQGWMDELNRSPPWLP